MQIRDLMTTTVESVGPETSLYEVISTMTERDIRHLPVLDRGTLVGMVSDRDVRAVWWDAATADGARALKVPVSEIMSGDVLSVGAEDDVSVAIDLFCEQKVGALPVVDDVEGNLVGIVSTLDVLKFARDTL